MALKGATKGVGQGGYKAPVSRGGLLWLRLGIFGRQAWNSWLLFKDAKIGVIGLVIILLFASMMLLHPLLLATVWEQSIYDPLIGFDYRIPAGMFHPLPPSPTHLLGTDPQGRDILSQLMFSTRGEFGLGILAALVTLVVAPLVGALSAYYGRWIDAFLMRLADLVIMLPTIALLIVLGSLFNIGFLELAIVLGLLGGFGGAALILKSQALTIKVRPYVEAAKVSGSSDIRIVVSHIIPNLLPLATLYMMFTVTAAIFSEAVLSFFGILDIRMSWGIMLNTTQANGYLLNFGTWWLIIPAGLAVTLLCGSFYLVGRGLDPIVNPRLRSR